MKRFAQKLSIICLLLLFIIPLAFGESQVFVAKTFEGAE
jgi:hypothetical protein